MVEDSVHLQYGLQHNSPFLEPGRNSTSGEGEVASDLDLHAEVIGTSIVVSRCSLEYP